MKMCFPELSWFLSVGLCVFMLWSVANVTHLCLEHSEVTCSLSFIPLIFFTLSQKSLKLAFRELTETLICRILALFEGKKQCLSEILKQGVEMWVVLERISVFGSGAVLAWLKKAVPRWPLRYYLWYLLTCGQLETQEKCLKVLLHSLNLRHALLMCYVTIYVILVS